MKDLLSYILKHILEKEAKIKIDEEDSDGFVNFSVAVPKEYMGKVIGKGGKTIHAIKSILKIKAAKENKKVNLELVESQ